MRIAHISDFHLRHHLPTPDHAVGDPNRLTPAHIARALAHIASLAPDLLVVTGDLVDFPFELGSDPTVGEQARRDYLLIADLLAQVSCPVAIVHGNHDRPDLFHTVFPTAPTDQIIAGHRILTFNDHEAPDHVPSRTGGERSRFLAALDNRDPAPQIHIQHYLIWPAIDEDYPFAYGESAWLYDQIIAAGRVRLVLSGHYHRGVPLFCDKDVWFAVAPAFTEPPHPWRVYDLEGDEIVSTSFTLGI